MSHTFSDRELIELPADQLRRQIIVARESLIRDHFAETPLALASIVKTGVNPWNVILQAQRVEPGMNATQLRVVERARVIELPRDSTPTAAEREQWERDDEAEGKAIARAAEMDVEDEL